MSLSLNWSEVDLAWMAGLLEGEGCFYATRRARMIRCAMTDRDVIERLHKTSGIGTVHLATRQEGRKQAWTWQVGKLEQQIPFLYAIRPFMGERRAAKIGEFLQIAEVMVYRGACSICDGSFVSYRVMRQTCSEKCNQAFQHRKRKAA